MADENDNQDAQEVEEVEPDSEEEDFLSPQAHSTPEGADLIYTCCECGGMINTSLSDRCTGVLDDGNPCEHDKCPDCKLTKDS